jgi:glycosyltransferase involved in cell wall biosynthesis
MDLPLLTVAIPTVHRLGFLREAVASACAQDYPNFEVLISDDGNDPAIREFALQAQQEDGRVRYIRTCVGVGLSGNWNWCADKAKGTHLVIIGDDDRLLPSFLRALAPATLRSDVVFCNHFLIDETGDRRPDTEEQLRVYGRGELAPGPLGNPERVVWMNAVAPSATLVRTKAVRSVRFDPSLNTPELDFFVRLAATGASFYFDRRYLSEYRAHTGSETARGLWHDRLFFALVRQPAMTDSGALARRAQLSRLARIAAVEALLAGRPDVAANVAQSGFIPRPLAYGIRALTSTGPDLGRKAVLAARTLRRALRTSSAALRIRSGRPGARTAPR